MKKSYHITWTAILILITNLVQGSSAHNGRIFINEIHYDNRGTDRNVAVEIAGPAGVVAGVNPRLFAATVFHIQASDLLAVSFMPLMRAA